MKTTYVQDQLSKIEKSLKKDNTFKPLLKITHLGKGSNWLTITEKQFHEIKNILTAEK